VRGDLNVGYIVYTTRFRKPDRNHVTDYIQMNRVWQTLTFDTNNAFNIWYWQNNFGSYTASCPRRYQQPQTLPEMQLASSETRPKNMGRRYSRCNSIPALFNQCARCTEIYVGCTTKKELTKVHHKLVIFTKLSVSKNEPLTNQWLSGFNLAFAHSKVWCVSIRPCQANCCNYLIICDS